MYLECLCSALLFFKSKLAMINESDMYWDSNPHVLKSIIATRFDGICGTILLLFGFIFQLIGYIGFSNNLITGISYILLALFILAYFGYLREITIIQWCDDLKTISKLHDSEPNSENLKNKAPKIVNI